MRLLLASVVALAVFVSPVRAEDEYTVKLTANEWAVIAAALGEVPFRIADPVVTKLRVQLKSQDKQSSDKVEPENKGK